MATSDSSGSTRTSEGTGSSPSPNRFEWLLEEYKLLSEHVRHEDTELKKTLVMFLTLNIGLLSFATSNLAVGDSDSRWITPVAGVLLWLPWIPSMVRIRAFRSYFEDRIRRIEDELQKYWDEQEQPGGSPSTPNKGFRVLDIRSFEKGEIGRIVWPPKGFGKLLHDCFGNWPTSFTYLFLPGGFLVLWLVLLGMRLNWWAALVALLVVLLLYMLPALWSKMRGKAPSPQQ